MRTIRNSSAGALLLAAHAATLAQSMAQPIQQPMQQVTVNAGADQVRTQATTTAIVIRHDEIVRHGDASLADVLKRQPGITLDGSPGAAPAIRMRGLGGGYVAILLDGVPAPGGFSLESLDPDLIERIEIGRVATAETSSQAVAGTINVILRRANAGTREIKAGSAFTAGYAAPQLLVQHGARHGPLTVALTATLRRNRNPIEAVTREEGLRPALLRDTAWFDHQVEDVLELAPRLTWQPTGRDSITSQSYLRRRRIDNVKRETESTLTGSPTAYPRADQAYRTDPLHAYADLAWNRKLDAGARLALKLSTFYTTRDADFVYRGRSLDATLLRTNAVASGPTEREWTANGSWRRPVWGNHTLAAGWEAGRKARTEYRRERQFDGSGAQLLASAEDYRAQVARSAFFVQDEWDISPAWSAYVGLRREDLRTTGQGNAAAAVDVDAGAWSPIFQTLYRPVRPDGDTGPRDGWRLAMSRSYKAPNIIQLMPRRYTVDNNNSATNPDQQGNPGLRPELALGVDLAWERTFGQRDMVSVSAFHKRIRDITLIDISASGGVWTATPVNAGKATVRGIEFEGKAAFGRLAARVNLARNWSRVDSVPGPGNRIAGQPAYSGNLGLDYAAAAGGIDLGSNYTYRGRSEHRSESRSSTGIVDLEGAQRQLDLYALWKRDARTRLRLSVSDLLQQDVLERRAVLGEAPLARSTTYRVRATWRLVWERTL